MSCSLVLQKMIHHLQTSDKGCKDSLYLIECQCLIFLQDIKWIYLPKYLAHIMNYMVKQGYLAVCHIQAEMMLYFAIHNNFK